MDLHDIFEIQKAFQRKVFPDATPEEATKELILHLVKEATDFMDETSWKAHRRDTKTIIRSNLLEEGVDVFKLLVAVLVHWDFTADDLIEEFERKSAVVEQRWHQEMELAKITGPVAGVDIDGVLANYARGFSLFIERQTGIMIEGSQINQEIAFRHKIGVGKYEHLKHLYRESGEKVMIPVYPGASSFLKALRQRGFSIVLLTARPYKKYKRMFADTLSWLNKHELLYDALIFDEDKNIRLYREFGDRVLFFIEDDFEKARGIADLGVRVFLMDHPYNRIGEHPRITRVSGSITEILEYI